MAPQKTRTANNVAKRKTGRKKKQPQRIGGGEGSEAYRIKMKQINKHWCKAYRRSTVQKMKITNGRKEVRKKHFQMKELHDAWMKEGCKEYNWWGKGKHPMGNAGNMAERILEEVGGCRGNHSNCDFMVEAVKTHILNVGKELRKQGRLWAFTDEKGEKVDGVEILRSKSWARDRKLEKTLKEYDPEEVFIIKKMIVELFPEQFVSLAEELEDESDGEPELADILDDTKDLYIESAEMLPANPDEDFEESSEEEEEEDEDEDEDEEMVDGGA